MQLPKMRKLDVMTAVTCPEKTYCVHGWIECVFLLPSVVHFSIKSSIPSNLRWQPICRNTSQKYTKNLTYQGEKEIDKVLPDRFAFIFGGQNVIPISYISLFTTFSAVCEACYERVLLDISPIEIETTQWAQEHYEILEFVLSAYSIYLTSPVASIGDHSSTDSAFARLIAAIYVGCYSHRYDLAVEEFMSYD